MEILETECLGGGLTWFCGGDVFGLDGIGAGGFFRDRMSGWKADLMLAEWAWRGRRISLDLAEAAGRIDGDRLFGRRAYFMLIELAWQWSCVSVSGVIDAG